jgi:hypothetical protein
MALLWSRFGALARLGERLDRLTHAPVNWARVALLDDALRLRLLRAGRIKKRSQPGPKQKFKAVRMNE